MNNDIVIEAKNLTKVYDKFKAVDSLNLQVSEGEIFGLLGPNGAGKTTTILMLTGLSEPSGGTARIYGLDPARDPIKVKSFVGYMPEKIGFYDDLTARENLEYTGRLNGIYGQQLNQKISEVINNAGLTDYSEQIVGKFSHGMKQRLGIADVMIKSPKVAIFDEPTSGIDPEGTDQVLNLIKSMAKQKITVLISSHQLHQIQRVCTKVGIFSKGRMVASGSVDKLGREALRKGQFNIFLPIGQLTDGLRSEIRKLPGVLDVNVSNDSTVITADDNISKKLEEVVFQSTGLKVQMKVEEFALEDIYLQYFKES